MWRLTALQATFCARTRGRFLLPDEVCRRAWPSQGSGRAASSLNGPEAVPRERRSTRSEVDVGSAGSQDALSRSTYRDAAGSAPRMSIDTNGDVALRCARRLSWKCPGIERVAFEFDPPTERYYSRLQAMRTAHPTRIPNRGWEEQVTLGVIHA